MARQFSGTVRLPVMQAEKFSALDPPSRGPARNVACPHIGRHDLGTLPWPGQGRSRPRSSFLWLQSEYFQSNVGILFGAASGFDIGVSYG